MFGKSQISVVILLKLDERKFSHNKVQLGNIMYDLFPEAT